jgi:hypothetical protein
MKELIKRMIRHQGATVASAFVESDVMERSALPHGTQAAFTIRT